MLTMQRIKLTEECKEYITRMADTAAVYPTMKGMELCPNCKSHISYNSQQGENVCRSCGFCFRMIYDHMATFHEAKQYNCNKIHHYATVEHFAQSLCDFSTIGRRKVPFHVMKLCKEKLGTGNQITSQRVFSLLSQYKLRGYYACKYEITNRLRDTPEFVISSEEIRRIRDEYRRYDRRFFSFQREHGIGTCSKRGKMRVYWPMRFILARIFEAIGRRDLVFYLRKISDPKRSKRYFYYWNILKEEIELNKCSHDYGSVIVYPEN